MNKKTSTGTAGKNNLPFPQLEKFCYSSLLNALRLRICLYRFKISHYFLLPVYQKCIISGATCIFYALYYNSISNRAIVSQPEQHLFQRSLAGRALQFLLQDIFPGNIKIVPLPVKQIDQMRNRDSDQHQTTQTDLPRRNSRERLAAMCRVLAPGTRGQQQSHDEP